MTPIDFGEVTRRLLLEQFAPAAVLIDRKCEILHRFGPCVKYLDLPADQPTRDLCLMAREGLRARLRVAVRRAIREGVSVVLAGVRVDPKGSNRSVRVTVRPVAVPRAAEPLLLVTFEDEAPPAQPPPPRGTEGQGEPDEGSALRQLEIELKVTSDDLQSTIEELETTNEELRTSNEEGMTLNEELQSANEELETSREELQSVNEQLNTVNGRLREKLEELEKANNDIANLLDCTDIATVFLDASLRIKLFTPAATRLFHLIAGDVGRPIGDVTARFDDPALLRDAQQVLQQRVAREREVATSGGAWWTRRIMPYRTRDNRIDGVVITFVDITERKEAADAVVRQLAAIVESSADAIFSKDLDGTVRTWNAGAERLFGYTADEILGQSIRVTVPDERVEEWTNAMSRLARGEHVEQMETERVRKDGRRVAVAVTASPVRDAGGKVVCASVITRDISERKLDQVELERLTTELRAKVEELTTLLDILPVSVLIGDPRCAHLTGNRAFYEMFGLPPGTMISRAGWPPETLAGTRVFHQGTPLPLGEFAVVRTGLTGNPVRNFEYDFVFPDGRPLTLLANTATLKDQHGAVRGVVGVALDITERKRAELALRDREERLQAILNTAVDAIFTIDHRGIIRSANPATERMFGFAQAEMVGENIRMLMPATYREEHDSYLARYLQTGEKHTIGISREVAGRRKDGTVFPLELVVSEIEGLKLFTGILRDLTERKRLEREVVEIASLQQRRIGQDLHDSVAQELTALNLLARDLAETLRTDPTGAPPLVERINGGLKRSQQDLRAVLRGLLPVAVDSEGLMAALADLAERTRQGSRVTCTFDCPEPVSLADNVTATHLYLIAQEAVHNAIKHARPRTIRISLESNGVLVLRVQDDGIGMPTRSKPRGGLGLRIMRNRAAIIGATLTIERAEPAGTVATCVLPRKNNEPTKDTAARPGADRR